MKKTKFLSLKNIFAEHTPFSLVKLDNSIELSALFRRLGFRILSLAFPKKVKFFSRLAHLYSFSLHLFKMRKHHGPVLVVKYLKANHLSLQRYLAGQPLSTLPEVEPQLPLKRLLNGLPSIIPKNDRF
jgi:hypothetical protein